jgi:phage terminase small subunit
MTRKLTPKQEKFCQLYIELGDASAAYRGAYDAKAMKPTTINRKATELMRNGIVTARIDEIRKPIQERVAAKFEVTLENLTAMLFADRKKAESLEASAAGIACARDTVMAIAKLNGLIVDQVKTNNTSYVMGVERLKSEEEFDAAYSMGVESAAGSSDGFD